MNLVQPPRQLTSPIPRSQNELLTGNPYDVFRVLYWSLWSPPTLIAYTEQLLETHSIYHVATKHTEISPLYHLRLLALVAALLIVLGIGLIFTLLLVLFQLSNPLPSLTTIGGSAIAAVCAMLLSYGVCRLFIQDISLGMTAIFTLGTANGLLFGLAILASHSEAAEFRATLVGICFGGLFGLLISTFPHYLPSLRSAETYNFIFILTLNFVVWATFFFISIPFTWGTMAIAIVFGLFAFVCAWLRPDDWLLSLLFNYRTKEYNSFYFSQVSPLPSDTLARNLLHWLDIQWDEVIPLLPSFVAQRGQKKVVLKAINQALDDLQKDKDLLKKSEQIYVFYTSEDLLPKRNSKKKHNNTQNSKGTIKAGFLSTLQKPFSWRKLQSAQERKEYRKKLVLQPKDKSVSKRLRLPEENKLHSSMQGFHYLALRQPKAAKEAFDKASASDYRDEMSKIAGFLADLLEDEQISDNPPLKIPKKPRFPAHKATWDIFERLQKVVRYMWILRACSDFESFIEIVFMLESEFREMRLYLGQHNKTNDRTNNPEAMKCEYIYVNTSYDLNTDNLGKDLRVPTVDKLPEKNILVDIANAWEKDYGNITRYLVTSLAQSMQVDALNNQFSWYIPKNLEILEATQKNVYLAELNLRLDHFSQPDGNKVANLDDFMEHYTRVCDLDTRISSVKPVKKNPFGFTEPIGNNNGIFVGRKNQLNNIMNSWKVGKFRPILITGQRYSGKTSLIRQADSKSGAAMDIAYINSRQHEGRFTIQQILLRIADAIAEITSLTPPDFSNTHADPYRPFQQYIRNCCSYTGNRGLVVVLDGFEHIEQNIATPTSLDKLMHFLWALADSEPSLGVVFSTTTTLGEINESFNTPFSQTLLPIEVGFLNYSEVAELLQTSSPDFSPYITDDTVNEVFNYTYGQPFLTQLIGHLLVEHFNREVNESNTYRDPLIKLRDLELCLTQELHFAQDSRQYYTSVLHEASQIDPSAKAILKMIARNENGIFHEQLERALNLNISNRTLEILEKRQIIKQQDKRWFISIKLFKEWLYRE